MNPNQLALGAILPFVLGGLFYLLHRHNRVSGHFFILWPGLMAAGALWAVAPDLPRLVGAHALYLRLSQLPICDIFFWHYTIDRIEFDSPLFLVAWFSMAYGVITAVLDALTRAEKWGKHETRESAGENRGEMKAPAAIHFAIGWLVVTLVMAPNLWRAWTAHRPLGRSLTRWVIWSAVSGIWAILPSLIKRLGWVPPDQALNLFWGYGWISHSSIGHIQIAGPAILTALLALQYGVIVGCYFRAEAKRK